MNTKHLLPLLLLAALFASGCASLTGFHDGRSLGEGTFELTPSINFSQSPDFDDWEDVEDTVSVNIPTLFFPSIEVGGRYGVADRVDVTLRLNTNLNLGVGAKVQLLGDRESTTALALGAEVGTFGLIGALWNVQLPVYFSVHPKDNFAWYLSPRYIFQFASFVGAENGLGYLGGNTGLLFGRRNKFGFDIGYYRIGTGGESIGALQVGIGGRFVLTK